LFSQKSRHSLEVWVFHVNELYIRALYTETVTSTSSKHETFLIDDFLTVQTLRLAPMIGLRDGVKGLTRHYATISSRKDVKGKQFLTLEHVSDTC